MKKQTETRQPERPDVGYYWFVAALAFIVGGIGGMTVMDSVKSERTPKRVETQPAEPRTVVETDETEDAGKIELEAADAAQSQARKRPIAPEERIASAKSFISLFGEAPNPDIWFLDNRNSPESRFWRNDFRAEMIHTGLDGLSLTIGDHPDPEGRPWKWAGSVIRTHQRHGYGRYETFMHAAPGSGLISSLFTYTGPPFGDPMDEIDIEFNGAHPRSVELNAWHDGDAFGAKTIPLPFDTSKEYHLYAFDWHPDSITWYIDGIEVHRVEASAHDLPEHPGFLFMNLWTGMMYGWHGRPDFENGAAANYLCVSYLAPGDQGRTCADFYKAEQPLQAEWVRGLN